MTEVWRFPTEGWRENAKAAVAALAGRQFGRVRHDQLRVSDTTIRRWCGDGYLHPQLPRVYAVGHPARSPEGDLAAAALYAGPGAMLSHGTALFWLGLLRYPPGVIHVSTPRRVRSRDGIRVHGRRSLDRAWHRGLPVTSTPQALLDFAADAAHDLLRLALANADYHELLDIDALLGLTGSGIAGSAALKRALQAHLPVLAHTRSELEVMLVTLCERHGLPLPQMNVFVAGWLVDSHWPEQRVIVEVDGWRGHRTRAQLERDHRRDLELRALGYAVLRYARQQLSAQSEAVAADLERALR